MTSAQFAVGFMTMSALSAKCCTDFMKGSRDAGLTGHL